MLMLLTANLGQSGFTDVGYELFGAAKNSLGARTETGVTEKGSMGIYWVQADVPSTCAAVIVNSASVVDAVAIDDGIAMRVLLQNIMDEVSKVPRAGQTHKWTNVANDATSDTVAISTP